ncbi:hypothetical protein BH11ACT2_BH11ACT2_12890 [soil metagenome]
MLTVLIPWRPSPSRIPAFDAVVDWYRTNLPGVDIRTIDSRDPVFNLAQCRNDAIASIDDPDRVVVINDGDTIPQREPLLAAVAAAGDGYVHLPYTEYHWLGESGDAQFAAGTPLADCDFELVRGACSGVFVTTGATWRRHGGQDERFRGWGFEDKAWLLAHETIIGEPRRHDGAVYALHHSPELREGPHYDANAALMQRYVDASASLEAMRQLVSAA